MKRSTKKKNPPPILHVGPQPQVEYRDGDWMVRVREARYQNPFHGEREIGEFQYLVLWAIALTSPRASSLTILDFIVRETGLPPDHAQVQGAIKSLCEEPEHGKRPAYAKRLGREKSARGGPPVQLLGVTAAGLQAVARRQRQVDALYSLGEKYRGALARLMKELGVAAQPQGMP